MSYFNHNVFDKKVVISRLSLILLLLSSVFINACSSNNGANELTDITVLAQGVNIKDRPEMAEACKGFYVSPQKLKDFFHYSAPTHEEQTKHNSEKLPCYSSGSANLADEEIQWILRAGGVAEFYNEQKSITKICGVSCCDIVQGVC